MLSKLLGKKRDSKEKSTSVIAEKIAKMNLSDMRSYLKEKNSNLEVTEEGLMEIMLRLTREDTKTKKYYLSADDMDSKKKKAFEVILLVATHKKITVPVVEEIQKFINFFEKLIYEYDREHKDIYASRFKTVLASAVVNIENITLLHAKMNTLSE